MDRATENRIDRLSLPEPEAARAAVALARAQYQRILAGWAGDALRLRHSAQVSLRWVSDDTSAQAIRAA